MADDDDPARWIADLGEVIEPRHEFFRPASDLKKDQVRRWRALIELDRRVDAAHVGPRLGLGHAPILGHALDRCRNGLGLAKGLHRDARYRPHFLDGGGLVSRNGFGRFLRFLMEGSIGHFRSFRWD